jgi:hypothetical protein
MTQSRLDRSPIKKPLTNRAPKLLVLIPLTLKTNQFTKFDLPDYIVAFRLRVLTATPASTFARRRIP